MKRLQVIITVIIILLPSVALFLYDSSINYDPFYLSHPDREAAAECLIFDGVTARMDPAVYPVGAESVTVVLENKTDRSYIYGEGWTVYKYSLGKWREYPTVRSFTALAHGLPENESRRVACGLLRPLSRGFYRIEWHEYTGLPLSLEFRAE